jgi:aspartate kinase
VNCQDVLVREDIAEVSVVGVGMRSHCGVAEKMFKALAAKKVNIDAITTSEIRISCLVNIKDVDTALVAVCDAFELDKPVHLRT